MTWMMFLAPTGHGPFSPSCPYRRKSQLNAPDEIIGTHRFFRVFGEVKMTVLLGFTVAAFNLDRIRSYRAKLAEEDEAPRPRAKRRQGTWVDVVSAPPTVVSASGN